MTRVVGRFESLLIPIAAILTLIWIRELPNGTQVSFPFLSFELIPLHVDALSRVFAIIFALITGIAGIYGLHILSRAERVAAFFYAIGALGVTFAGDYISFYLFWELMAIASTYLIIARGKKRSRQAAFRYFFVHLTGGALLFAGILLQLKAHGSIAIESLTPSGLGPWLILAGIGLNAAVVPLHAWLPDAYPKASIGGAVFLSALTTKSALYALVRIFPGWEVLIFFGVLMALYGVVFAFLADDIRSVLAYHIVSQVGFMVAGVGLGTELALNGAVAHAFCHILYKALLFMGAGTLLFAAGTSRLSELGGLYGKLTGVFFLYMVGAVSISGFPLFNGFVSKAMTIAGAEQLHDYWTVTLLYGASVGTFLSIGLKVPYFAWFGKKAAVKLKPIPQTMYMGMTIAALFCFILGVYPQLLYRALPFPVDYQPYTAAHVIHTLWYLAATGLGFYLLLPKLKMKRTDLYDFDWFYRHAAFYKAIFVDAPGRVFGAVEKLSLRIVAWLKDFIVNPSAFLTPARDQHQPYDPDKQRLPLAWTVSAILGSFILFGVWVLLSA